MRLRFSLLPIPALILGGMISTAGATSGDAVPVTGDFRRSPWFGERIYEERTAEGVRLRILLPPRLDPERPTRLIVYATPNGNSLEETLGEERSAEKSWRYDIQHAAAQVRRLRDVDPRENRVLACVEAEGKSWPAWRARNPEHGKLLRGLVAHLRAKIPVPASRVTLTGHSGGGSFLLGYVAGGAAIPPEIDRIAFLDANYSYADDLHAERFLTWLRGGSERRLIVLAYDDRRIELDGKPVVGPTGGTFRASHRMLDRFRREGAIAAAAHSQVGAERPEGAEAGPAVLTALAGLSGEAREKHLLRQLERGNVPPALRTFVTVRVSGRGVSGKEHTLEYQVLPDYLGAGGDGDYVRTPMTPMTAQRIADLWDCTLPTRKMVNDIYRQAAVKLAPRPLTEAREAPETFLQHHRIVEGQQAGTLGRLVAGIKKDVVLTNRLREKPARVAIYGWHQLNGAPIQPLTLVHRESYVDYSHGVRLIRRDARVDGREADLVAVFQDPELHPLVSDEGILEVRHYPVR